MAFVPTSQYVPGPPSLRLDWSGDPLRGAPKRGITPGMARIGRDYNRSLYAPDSPQLRALIPQAPATPRYSTGYQGATGAARTGSYVIPRFGTASVTSAAPPAPITPPAPALVDTGTPPIPFSQDDSGVGGKRLDQFRPGQSGAIQAGTPTPLDATGAAGPTVEVAPVNPSLTTPDAVPHPATTGDDLGINFPAPAINPGAEATVNRLPAGSAVSGFNSTTPSTQRYLDRKFGRMSHDPTTRMMSRRTDGSAPNVSNPINPVTFNNEVAGHSNWQPY